MFRAYCRSCLFGVVLLFGTVDDALAGPSDASAAQALFDQAKAEMARGDYRSACSKLEESQRLDPALGTLLNLADCLEKQGKIATAWSAFREAEGLAHRNGPADAESVAHERAAALEQRVPRLVIAMAAGQPSDLRVTRNGVAVGPAQLGTAIPLDPGEYRVVAWAPGYQSWEATVSLQERAGTLTLSLPLLTKDAKTPPKGAAQPPVPPLNGDTEPKHSAPVAAWVLGGVGVAAVGASAGLGLWAKSQYRSADCPEHICQTDTDYQDRQQARTKATVATVVFIGGALALGTGIVIWSLSPSQPQRPRTSISLAVQAPGLVLGGAL